MSERESLLDARRRDERLRNRAREKVRYEMEGAAKMGVEPNESWDVLQEGRDVLSLLRERDAMAEALRRIHETASWYAKNGERIAHEVDHALCVEVLSYARDGLG